MKEQITLDKVIQILDKAINKERAYFEQFDFIVGVSRGGLIPAAWIATHLNKPLITAYIDKKGEVYADRTEWLKDKKVLIIDDTRRTGETINKIMNLIQSLTNKEADTFFIIEDPDNKISFPWDIYD